MPDLMSHIFMGHDVLNALPEKNRFKKSAVRSIGVFNNGLQGPDPFFYNGALPWNKHSLSHLGDLLHREKTGAWLRGLIRILENDSDCLEKRTAYLAGLICHYTLDTTAHPYIFFFSGVDPEGRRPEFSVCHKRLEIILDMLLIRKKIKEPAHRLVKADLLDASEDTLCAYRDASSLLGSLYGKTVPPRLFLDSLSAMKKTLGLLHDPLGIKTPLFRGLDRLLRTRGLYEASVYSPSKLGKVDYANQNRNPWRHPATGETRSESFFDLYDLAVERARVRLLKADAFLSGSAEESLLEEAFPDLDYDTGLPPGHEMRFHRCLFL